jgi:integrase/recombinase XerC
MKDKSYRALPLGLRAGDYLRTKRRRLTESSYRDYESILDKLARYFADLDLCDLEPPVGTERVEEFLEHQWGAQSGRTFNKALSVLHDFFKHHQLRGNVQGDPTLAIERAKKRDVYRETIPLEDRLLLLAANDDLRDRVALRLLLDYGIRKGSLQGIQYRHFDHQRRRLSVVQAKGGKARDLPIPDLDLWLDLERLIIDVSAEPHHYLLCRQKTIPFGPPDEQGKRQVSLRRFPDKPMGAHGAHAWWYRCQERAGLVAPGQTSGAKMHRTRYTAGQRVLDATGNLKAVQALLGHASISTTADTYTDWDVKQLEASLLETLGGTVPPVSEENPC